MRCLTCGVEMNLVGVVRDDTMMVEGYEDQTFECPECHEVERRRTFSGEEGALGHEEQCTVDAADVPAAPADNVIPLRPGSPERHSLETGGDPDDGEEMLRRAIAMVRGAGSDQPIRGLIDRPRSAPRPTSTITAVRPKKSGSARVVQIRHDPGYETAYAAKDTKTGLVVLRHRDSARLRSMCDRLGWQVLED